MKKIFIIFKFCFISFLGISQVPIFCDTILYYSYYNETVFGQKITQQPEVVFSFNNDIIATTMKDQMSCFRSYGIIAENNDQTHIWKKYQCIDNSGSKVNIIFAYEKLTNVKIVVIDYGSMFMYFEVNEKPIPKKVYDVLDDLVEQGYLGDNKYETTYSNEQVDSFLNKFGINRKDIIKLMITNIFTVKNPSGTIDKYDAKGKLIEKDVQYGPDVNKYDAKGKLIEKDTQLK